MHHNFLAIFVLVLSMATLGCTHQAQSTSSVQDVIAQSNTLATIDTKVEYLLTQAQDFIVHQKYDEAMALANHVLSNVDQNSRAAEAILEKTNSELQKVALTTADDINSKFNSL